MESLRPHVNIREKAFRYTKIILLLLLFVDLILFSVKTSYQGDRLSW